VLIYNYMVVHHKDGQRDDHLFHALADATRRDILRRCLRDEYSVSAIASHYPMSFAAVQKHVAVLETAGLVSKRRRGREQLVCGDASVIRYTKELLEQFEAVWRGRLDRFGEILQDSQTKGAST